MAFDSEGGGNGEDEDTSAQEETTRHIIRPQACNRREVSTAAQVQDGHSHEEEEEAYSRGPVAR